MTRTARTPVPAPPVRSVAGTLLVLMATLLAALLIGGCRSAQDRPMTDVADAVRRNNANAEEAARIAQQAEALASKGRTNEAIAKYEQALRTSAELPAVWNNLGVLYLQQQRYVEAVETFKVAMDRDPSDPRPAENVGNAYHLAGHDDEAQRYYLMALDRDPNWVPALRGLSRTIHRLGTRDSAMLEHIERALLLERDPQWRDIFERQRVLLSGDGRDDSRS